MSEHDESAEAAAHQALVASAQQAIAAGDAARAVELLRQAVRLAPFRQDTRELLGVALEMALQSGVNLAAVATPSAAVPGAAPASVPAAGVVPPDMGAGAIMGARPAAPASPVKAFQRLHRETSLRLRLWLAGATVLLLFCATLAIILYTPVREYMARLQAQKDPKARELAMQQEEAQKRIQQQNYAKALEILENAKSKAEKPEDLAAIAKQKAEALRDQADALYKQDKYEEAIPFYLQAIEIQKNSVDLYKSLARAHYYQAENLRLSAGKKTPPPNKQKMDGHYQEAEKSFRRVLELDEKNVEVAKLLALTYIRLNLSSKAIYKCYQILLWAPKSDEAKWAREQLISRNHDPNKIPEALEQESKEDSASGDKVKSNGDKAKSNGDKGK
ncbi:MAG: tetratricopeptide repeat protein [Candidatus Sumerlaeota bacterium]|nr:tetratricopeptide repeat protein [Candidatus Sumerlaeota bacterium]